MDGGNKLIRDCNEAIDARLREIFGCASVMIKVHAADNPADTSVLFMMPSNSARLTARGAAVIGEQLSNASACAEMYKRLAGGGENERSEK